MFKLVENEGLFLGISSGINVAGALRLADIGPGKILLRFFVIQVQDT